MEAAGAPPFELSGGALCLDFANTWGDRERAESDRLRSYEHLLAFARQTATLGAAELDSLARLAAASPADAATAFTAALRLRDAVYRLLSDHARGRHPSRTDLDLLNAALRDALCHLRLEDRAGGGYGWAWADGSAGDLLAPLRPLVRSAADLLASDDLHRVRECDGSGCTWLFLDGSRNRSRRWCSMESCGNRAKAARHYRRSRGEGGST